MAFEALEEIVKRCEEEKKPFWQVVMEEDAAERGVTVEESMEQMRAIWDAMLLAAATYDKDTCSASRMAGGDGYKMEQYAEKEESLCGSYMTEVIAGALQMGESNACMKRIVAAPTAGACGVLPAVLVPWFRHKKGSTEDIMHAMYTSAGIGQVIATRASISGAQGGCQAEIGSASSMAAGALVTLKGGSPEQIVHAAAIALKNLLGLVCDPVAGLVEVPCIKRG
ncbi:MAG: L-serine ammonia-lyase, iron-sulfur-dependent, subunit beta, partial [Lachnospiraceae bacterium]